MPGSTGTYQVQGSYYRHMPESTRIVPPPHAPNMILSPRLDDDDDDNDDHGIEILDYTKHTVDVVANKEDRLAAATATATVSTLPLLFATTVLLLRYEQCTISTLPPRRDGFHTLQYHDHHCERSEQNNNHTDKSNRRTAEERCF